jgi:hypothetical protein
MQGAGEKIPETLFIGAFTRQEIIDLSPSVSNISDRTYELIYAQKFRALGGIPKVNAESTIEITRFDSNSQSRTETLKLIREAKAVHAFENSSIITEAQLCGVPVFCYQNKFFDQLIAEHELGNEGTVWNSLNLPSCNPELIRSRLLRFEDSMVARVDETLSRFESGSQIGQSAGEKLHFNAFVTPIRHRAERFMALLIRRGPRTALRFLMNFLKRSLNRELLKAMRLR